MKVGDDLEDEDGVVLVFDAEELQEKLHEGAAVGAESVEMGYAVKDLEEEASEALGGVGGGSASCCRRPARARTHVFARGVDEGGLSLLEEAHDAGKEDLEELGGVDVPKGVGVDRVAELCCDCEPELDLCWRVA